MEFAIYHLPCGQEKMLDASVSIALSRVKAPYRGLDKSLVDYYSVSKMDSMLIVENSNLQTFERYVTDKCTHVKILIEQGLYELVAKVQSKNHIDAFVKATNINKVWYQTKSKDVEVIGYPKRSTGTNDLIEWESKFYLICPLGFIDVEEAIYFKMDAIN